MSTPLLRRSRSTLPILGCLLLALLLALTAAACPDTCVAGGTAPLATIQPAPLVAGFLDDVLGNQTRMIQVGVVFVVVGILFLMRSPK